MEPTRQRMPQQKSDKVAWAARRFSFFLNWNWLFDKSSLIFLFIFLSGSLLFILWLLFSGF